jgi:PAS domain S-box-containing protein
MPLDAPFPGTAQLDMSSLPPEVAVALVETAPVGFFVFQDDRIVFANAAASELFGRPREVLLRLSLSELRGMFWAEDLALIRARVASAKRGEPAPVITHRIRRADGTVRFVDAHVSFLRMGSQEAVRVVFYDVSDRQASEASLQASESRLRTIADSARDSIFCKGLDRRYTFVNRAMSDLLGASADELLGKTPSEVFSDEEARIVSEVDDRCLAGEEVSAHRTLVIGGEEYTFHTIQAPMVNHRGEVIGITGIVRDISATTRAQKEKAHLEEQLLQAQKLEAIGRLAGGVAHDFNNLLTEISGNASLALMNNALCAPEAQAFTAINDAARRAATLTRQLLAFSRKQVFQPTLISLDQLVGNLEGMLRRLLGEEVRLKLDLDAAQTYIIADSGQLEQVILNLCINARDAMPSGGTITLSTRPNEDDDEICGCCPEEHGGRQVRLQVTDTGIGMDQETIAHIFEPFFTTKTVDKGTGLGLSTTYGIVQQHGGAIHVTSTPGEGTTFQLCFPAADGTSDEMPPPSMDEVLTGTEVVLYVEDEPAVREVTVAILEKLGYAVFSAATPGEALALLASMGTAPDLLLTDINLPEMNGRELAVEVRRHLPTLPVLLTSGYTDNIVALEGHDGHDGFIGKPFTPRGLSLKLRQLLRR